MSEFFDKLFGDSQGYVCVELFRNSQPVQGGRKWVQWPNQKSKLDSLSKSADRGDLYFRPVLFDKRSVDRAAVVGSHVAWADVDSAGSHGLGASLVVASGTPGHCHAYWLSDRLLGASETESWNYLNCLLHGADKGGWDITQLLRVPNTLNHKTDPPTNVSLVECNDNRFPLPDEAVGIRVPHYNKPDILPNANTVLESNALSERTTALLSNTPEQGHRSSALFELACLLSEDGLSANDAYVILDSVDQQWGKFTGRFDRDQRLGECIARAYQKTLVLLDDEPDKPVVSTIPESRGLQPIGWRSLAKNLPEVKWLIKDVLRDSGMLMLAGASGVGKSQLSIGMCARLVLGAAEWAGLPITTGGVQQKILYLSLEMDQHGVKYTTDHMSQVLNEESLVLLEENLVFHATLESYKLDNTSRGKGSARSELEAYFKEQPGFTGLVVDTLGSATSKGLMDEVNVRSTIDWLKHLRGTYGLWITLLAHPRKEGNDSKRKELTIDDIYGSQLQQADLDSAFILSKVQGQQGFLKLQNVKTRFGPDGHGVILRRNSNLWLEKTNQVISEAPTGKSDDFDLEDDSFGGEKEWS